MKMIIAGIVLVAFLIISFSIIGEKIDRNFVAISKYPVLDTIISIYPSDKYTMVWIHVIKDEITVDIHRR